MSEIMLRKVVNDERLRPLGPVGPGLVSAVGDSRVQEQDVDASRAGLLERKLSEGPGASEVGELEGKDRYAVFGHVEVELAESRPRPGDIAGTEKEFVWLSLGEELFDGLEAL
jgi:hypothetical protein